MANGLPHLLVVRPFCERDVTHQVSPNPLDFLGDSWRILERRFFDEERFHALEGILNADFSRKALGPVQS